MILDTFIKKGLPFFELFPAHLHSKLRKSAYVFREKQNFLFKNSIWVSKNAELYADLKSF
jgi:hypothetical protein